MGEMATGLAHELNQPLGSLQLYASAAKSFA
jgi:C4-dicarboxylate-specific signal transduction histidine kinase